jgi:hypothetical protein
VKRAAIAKACSRTSSEESILSEDGGRVAMLHTESKSTQFRNAFQQQASVQERVEREAVRLVGAET